MHLAGETHVARSYDNPIKSAEVNVMQTIYLLEACRSYGKLKTFLYMSTDEVYGDANPIPCDECTSPDPTNPYSASKAAAEQFVRSFKHSFGLPVVVVRVNNVYGPRQTDDKVIPKFIKNIFLDQEISIHGTGQQCRNWLFVEDVCRALWAILCNRKIGETYNIGSPYEFSILDLAKVLFETILKGNYIPQSAELKIAFTLDRPHNDKFYHINWSKIKNQFNWEPSISFEQGIQKTIDWYAKTWAQRVHVPKPLFLIYGHKGWIGNMFIGLLKDQGYEGIAGQTKPGFDSDSAVEAEIDKVKPTHVVSLLGRTHGPLYETSTNTKDTTIDYLEGGPDKLKENLRDNLYAPLVLALMCQKRKILLGYLGTGCVFCYDQEHPIGSALKMFSEKDAPNFFGSSYSIAKGFLDRVMHNLENTVINARIRMPIADDWSKRDFVRKIVNYSKVVDIPNSVTVLPQLLPVFLRLMLEGKTGTFNLVNPKPISHGQVLQIYKEEETLILSQPFSVKTNKPRFWPLDEVIAPWIPLLSNSMRLKCKIPLPPFVTACAR